MSAERIGSIIRVKLPGQHFYSRFHAYEDGTVEKATPDGMVEVEPHETIVLNEGNAPESLVDFIQSKRP